MRWLKCTEDGTAIYPLTVNAVVQEVLSVQGGILRSIGEYESTDELTPQISKRLEDLERLSSKEQVNIKDAYKAIADEFEGKVLVHEQELYGGIRKSFFTMLYYDKITHLVIPEPGSIYPSAMTNNYYIFSCRLATREEIDEYQSITGI